MRTLLIVLSLTISSCASPSKTKTFDGKWFFLDDATGKPAACLSREDVEKLIKLLSECKAD